MFMRLLIAAFMLCFMPVMAFASACYTQQEMEAEQGLRIHSELMVIALNCQHIAGGNESPYAQYQAFTKRHADIFGKYEQVMQLHFEHAGADKPERALDTMRTKMANKISADAAKMRPAKFCQTFLPRIDAAMKMSGEDVKVWAGTFYKSHPVSKPLCQ